MKNKVQRLIVLSLFVLMTACASLNAEQAIDLSPGSSTASNADMQYYFTSPNRQNHCELTVPLLSAIDRAQHSIDLALYNINMEDIADALIIANQRGVAVRIVLDDNKQDNKIPQKLADAGISMVYDPDKSTMHNKFMIIDGQQVWMGSMNFTESGCEDDYNNMLRVSNERIANNYAAEFAEMYEEYSFSADSPSNTPYTRVQVGDVLVETYFSPDDGVRNAMLDVIEQATDSIIIMAYSFTSDKLADAIIERAESGVQVLGVMDADQIKSNTGSEYEDFLRAGIDIKQDNIDGQMHHKVIIIDEQIVITGSYNFSANAEKRNDENVLIIHSSGAAQQFLNAFETIKTK
ncbi:MAG: DUF1669 domain-containing protein [Anaerolineaceae bacterium]|nr:DUF1669 domain-containing protein [Anaerolineaceae bacterium]